MRELTDELHYYGARVSVQLAHTGAQGALQANNGELPISPSGIPDPVIVAQDPRAIPRTLSLDEIKELIEFFAMAAFRAQMAGFDAVDLHGCHGYLMTQFLSPLTNKRTDLYGGDVTGRTRFITDIIKRIKNLAGPDFPVIVRLNGDDFTQDGLNQDDYKAIALLLAQAGADAINVSAGTYVSMDRILPPEYHARGFLVPLAEGIKKAVNIPVMASHRITSLEMAEEILQQGKADLVCMGRALIAEPHLVKKTKEGRPEDINHCIYCNYCCTRVLTFSKVRCAVNPEAGREGKYRLNKAEQSKKVLVVGGGPGGMEAARVSALRGHDVTLIDKNEKLGGLMLASSGPSFKQEHRDSMEYFSTQVKKAGVKIELGKKVTPEVVKNINPEVVILATGSSTVIPDIPGIEGKNVVTAIDVLTGKKEVGERVTIAGGGLVGCETAAYLVEEKGKKVVLVEMLDDIALDLDLISKMVLIEKLGADGVEILTKMKITEITDKGVVCLDPNQKSSTIESDSVVLALGLKARKELAGALRGEVAELYEIGDCVEPRNIHDAIDEAAHIGREI